MFRSGYYIGWEVIHDDPPWKKMYYHTERDMMDEEIIGYEVDFINFPDVDKKDGYKHEMIRTLFQK